MVRADSGINSVMDMGKRVNISSQDQEHAFWQVCLGRALASLMISRTAAELKSSEQSTMVTRR